MNSKFSENIIVGDSEMAVLMRSLDWSQTPLGPISDWAQSLKTSISILMSSRYPMFLWWGCEYANLYNDAYRPILGTSKHPQFLGQSAKDCWTEVWDVMGPLADSVLATGESTWCENLQLIIGRNGYPEAAYFTFSFNPARDETGKIGGIFCAVMETTKQVIGERQLRTLRELNTSTIEAKTVEEACHLAIATLSGNTDDIPFALLYLVEPDGSQARLVSTTTSIQLGSIASPQQVNLTQTNDLWHLSQVNQTRETQLVEDLRVRFGELPGGAWQSAHSALVMPLTKCGQTQQLAGLLVVGISPWQSLDDEYRGFFDLVASHVTTAMANTKAYEAQRKRAEALAELDRVKTLFFSNISHEFPIPSTLMLNPMEDLLVNPSDQNPCNGISPTHTLTSTAMAATHYVEEPWHCLPEVARGQGKRGAEGKSSPVPLCSCAPELTGVEATLKLAQLPREATQQQQTLRLEAETAREAVESILSRIGDGFFTLDVNWRFTYANNRLCEILGKRREELLGYNTWELFPDAIETEIYVQFHQAMREQTPLHFEYLYSPWNRWFKYRVYPSPNGLTIFVLEVTDSKLAEAEIQTLNQTLTHRIHELQVLFDLLPVGIAIAEDVECKKIRYNAYLSRILQVPVGANASQNAPLEQRPADGIFKKGGEVALEQLPMQYAAIHNTEVREKVLDIVHPDGSVIKLLCYASPLHDDGGRVTAVIGGFLNITERIRTEAALRESEEQFRLFVTASSDLVYKMNADWSEMRHLEGKDFLASTENPSSIWLERYILPEDRSQVLAVIHEAIRTKSIFELEHRVIKLDGTVGWTFSRAIPLLDAQNEIIEWFGTASEVTDRKQAEVEREQLLARVQSANETLQKFIEHTPVAVAMLDRKMRYLFASQRWMREYASGYTDLKGLCHYEAIADIPQRWRLVHQRCLAGATERCEEDYFLRHDGSAQWLRWEILPWYASGGEIGGIVIFVENITERKQAAQERQMLLEREQAAREQAEAANRIKDEFLAVLSHELRSPLNPILGWSKLLQNTKLDEARTKQALATIERNAKLQSGLIEDLLDVSRIIRGKLSLTISPVNLASTIQGAMETVRLAAEAKSIEIHTRLDPEIGLVLGDLTRLQQVVWNLLSNAVKFTPNEGRVEVQLEKIDHYAQITVSDNGKGITPEFLPHVFEYFRQEDGTTTRKFGGLGLGLAIVRHLLELHGGTVQADSPGDGLGATFTVRLPLMPTQPTVNQVELSELSLNLKGIQVLVVDDDTDTRDLVNFVLQQAGARVIAVSCASEAITILRQFHCDVLLSDIGMPETDGYMLIQQLEALLPQQGRQIKAIALTAYAGDFNQQKALEAGFQRHITKPIEPQQLLKEIVQLLRQGTG
ncbi:PAS domain-containing protein [Nostoc punctiforme FACHB-252]|uniref:histidine kinase n=1 Tax=Nostoc punctiforme FACHB-252 TaxID=1357509 RepID=A0ABR8HB53_NOSPU|nr:PAS domain-containing protein [Nostoc punctiforme]MBD2612668.1 PAS domain-containing protein [Nostoc punctiforme FACHB-252]